MRIQNRRRAHLFKDGDNRPTFFASMVIGIEAVLGDIEVQRREGDVRKVGDGVHDFFVKFFSSKLHGDFHGLRHLVGNYTIHILSVQFLPTWITHASHIVLPSIHDKIKSSAFID